ncbi:hypothetical protein PF438_14750 [Elizabethkingia meningoseptica]|uniref:hypothetical protein n=1 Tax=Elizabethkingia meningoseptica TaxID=238 RepID=UPI0022F1DB29|nr:hypothetical protein [Elizabethkingia meningoseptica]EJK5328086.1 hypothetical protein [Elizabethkingia meningoseptica]MCT3897564.1 hypothetical protein [Elizabethkingia anophelis]WBS74151.1 hypothetical protein PF438_14750 [Elizabethkingia meningoseptica]
MAESSKNEEHGKQMPKQIIIESGKICTVSGEWESSGTISTIVYVSKGESMPLYCGKKVKWILLKPG